MKCKSGPVKTQSQNGLI